MPGLALLPLPGRCWSGSDAEILEAGDCPVLYCGQLLAVEGGACRRSCLLCRLLGPLPVSSMSLVLAMLTVRPHPAGCWQYC